MLLPRVFPAAFGLGIGVGNICLGVLEGERPSAVVALATAVGVLGGCLVWVLKHVIQKTIPDMNRRHAEEMSKVCTTFGTSAKRDRRVVVKAHRELADRMDSNHKQVMEKLEGRKG